VVQAVEAQLVILGMAEMEIVFSMILAPVLQQHVVELHLVVDLVL
jgi:hypothetical protein